jgi:hypothetical protein
VTTTCVTTTCVTTTCMTTTRSITMYQAQHFELARQNVEQRLRPQRVHGIRRGARLIQLEIRRSRRSGHQQ